MRGNRPVQSGFAGSIKVRQCTQCGQTESGDVFGKKIQIERVISVPADQSLGDRTGHPVVEALPDDTERQNMSRPLVRVGTKAPDNLLESLKLGTDHLFNQDVRGRGRMQQFSQDQAVPPVLRIVDRQDVLEEVVDKERSCSHGSLSGPNPPAPG